MTQKEFAKHLHKSLPTIHSIESHRLALSPKLAQWIQLSLGVSDAWLLGSGDESTPVSRFGHPYSKDDFIKSKLFREGLGAFEGPRPIADLLGNMLEQIQKKDREAFEKLYNEAAQLTMRAYYTFQKPNSSEN